MLRLSSLPTFSWWLLAVVVVEIVLVRVAQVVTEHPQELAVAARLLSLS
jgi:hypothetical protein